MPILQEDKELSHLCLLPLMALIQTMAIEG